MRVRQVPEGWKLVALVGSLSIFGPLCIDMYLPAFPTISRDLHASASSVQGTLTACLIGIAFGQLLLGPISDRIGRRPPLLGGLVAFIISCIACAFATNIYMLTFFRLVQGLGGAAGIVIARSLVRDLFSGVALVRFFSTLMLATGIGPILAPQIGSWVLQITSWRGVFVVLAVFGSILLFSAWWRVPETLPPERRSTGGIGPVVSSMFSVARSRRFIGIALGGALGTSAAFIYISGSSFVLQNVYGLSPLLYGLVFALNAGGMIAGAQINGHLAGRFGPSRLMTAGLIMESVAGSCLVLIVVTGAIGLPGVIVCLFAVMFGNGFVGPNSVSLALQRYPNAAGSASAVLGFFQFSIAAMVAPLAGVGGTHDALPMALLILVLPVAALTLRLALAGPDEPEAVLDEGTPSGAVTAVADAG
jgi:MFS transporter, DHA1 family, multidrug resistance protein